MRLLLRFLIILILVVFLVLVHMAASSLLPYPLNAINSVMAVCLLIMMRKEEGLVVWVSFFCHFVIELYTKTPFGILLAAGTMSLLLGYWLYGYIFSNQSWYAALALSVIVMAMYRIIYTLGIIGTDFFLSTSHPFSVIVLSKYFFELLFTSLVVVIAWIILHSRRPRRDTERYRFFGYGS